MDGSPRATRIAARRPNRRSSSTFRAVRIARSEASPFHEQALHWPDGRLAICIADAGGGATDGDSRRSLRSLPLTGGQSSHSALEMASALPFPRSRSALGSLRGRTLFMRKGTIETTSWNSISCGNRWAIAGWNASPAGADRSWRKPLPLLHLPPPRPRRRPPPPHLLQVSGFATQVTPRLNCERGWEPQAEARFPGASSTRSTSKFSSTTSTCKSPTTAHRRQG